MRGNVDGGGFDVYFISFLIECPVVWCGPVDPVVHLELAIEGVPYL